TGDPHRRRRSDNLSARSRRTAGTHFLRRLPPPKPFPLNCRVTRRTLCASFAKPRARRSARLRARPLPMFIRRVVTSSEPLGCSCSPTGQRLVPPPRVTYVLRFG